MHDAQRSDAAPVPQRLQLDAFRVTHDADGPDLDPVQAREGAPSHRGLQYSSCERTKDL